jgi:hypothetical protein
MSCRGLSSTTALAASLFAWTGCAENRILVDRE